eukprot:TRINITY_DN56024_c1_g1_i1.p1 TRINITY_DN56024_c1_g1~~TRINITY_DN56024_c1_g1_i1.p1  ORF type:complete len:100 (+),score=3.97 TRINITY_DN56024_c1_g1_i1:24-302(+)
MKLISWKVTKRSTFINYAFEGKEAGNIKVVIYLYKKCHSNYLVVVIRCIREKPYQSLEVQSGRCNYPYSNLPKEKEENRNNRKRKHNRMPSS